MHPYTRVTDMLHSYTPPLGSRSVRDGAYKIVHSRRMVFNIGDVRKVKTQKPGVPRTRLRVEKLGEQICRIVNSSNLPNGQVLVRDCTLYPQILLSDTPGLSPQAATIRNAHGC